MGLCGRTGCLADRSLRHDLWQRRQVRVIADVGEVVRP